MGPGDELARELTGDRVALDETGEQALAEQLHHGIGVPAPERVKGAVFGEASIRGQQVSVGMPFSTRSTTGRRGPCCRAKRTGQTRRSSSRCCSTKRNSGDSRARLGF
jgi:hypothetical protein